jgi:ABC-type Na+ efflux pump permease subunit
VILQREYRQRVYSRSFVASTFLLPAVPVAIFLVTLWSMGSGVHGAPLLAPGHAQAAMAGAVLAAIVLLYVLFGSPFTW